MHETGVLDSFRWYHLVEFDERYSGSFCFPFFVHLGLSYGQNFIFQADEHLYFMKYASKRIVDI